MLYTGAVLLLCGYVYYALLRYDGELFLLPQQDESLVVRESTGTGVLSVLQRSAPPDALLFNNPAARKRLDSSRLYDGVTLPFSLRLESVEVLHEFPAEARLVITGKGGEREQNIRDGTTLLIDGTPWDVHGPDSWRGAIRNHQGMPMATIILPAEGAAAAKPLPLSNGVWRMLPSGTSLLFQWYDNEAGARAAFPENRESINACAWGVREGGQVHRFDAIRPGDALTLGDGSRVVLLESRDLRYTGAPADPAIRIGVQRDGVKSARWVTPEIAKTDALVQFTCPGLAEMLILIHAWREDEALVQVFQGNEARPVHRHALFEKLPADPGIPGLSVDQILRSGTEVPPQQASIQGLLLESEVRRVLLREGERRRVDDTDLLYRREAAPPEVAYTFRVISPAGSAGKTLKLRSGDQVRHGSWVFRIQPAHRDAAKSAVLVAQRIPGGWAHNTGLALFAAGTLGFVYQRFRGRQGRGED